MKKSLEKALRSYTNIIKATPKPHPEQTEEHWDRHSDAIAFQSQARDTDHFIEEELYSMQEGKVARMDELRQTLRDIDANKDVVAPEGAHPVTFKDGMFHVATYSSSAHTDKKFITLGDVLIAPSWGVEYDLDPETVPRWVRRRYALERAKVALRYMADMQIMHDEINSSHSDETVQAIYGIRFAQYLRGHEEKVGMLMEHIVESILRRLAIDCPLDIIVKNADVHDDVEQMTDFFVQRKGAPKAIAVQFTLGNRSVPIVDRKVRRAKRYSVHRTDVERVVVANLPFNEPVQTLLSRWAADAPSALTPIDVVPANVQERISYQILRQVLSEEELRPAMETIQRYLGIVRDDAR